jgi:hypothetical protein
MMNYLAGYQQRRAQLCSHAAILQGRSRLPLHLLGQVYGDSQ